MSGLGRILGKLLPESSAAYRLGSRAWHKVPYAIRTPVWKLYKRGAYQQIRFRGKTYVEGTDRSRSYRQLFPRPPVGKTVLDVGCNLGYYSLMALEEGAQCCRAIDVDPSSTHQLVDIAADLGLTRLEVVQTNILGYALEDDFDIVLCLNLLHHLGTIERVDALVDSLYRHTREQLILIVLAPIIPWRPHALDSQLNEPGGIRFLRISPSYFISRYGSLAHVQVKHAVTYGPDRYVVRVSKR